MLMLEGFASTYLSRETSPFLNDIAGRGQTSTLAPMFAFRGIEASIFTGLYPCDHKVWTEFKLRQPIRDTNSNMSNRLLSFLDAMPGETAKRASRYMLQTVLRREAVQMANLIPPQALDLFEPSVKSKMCDAGAVGGTRTFFDVLRSARLRFRWIEQSAIRRQNILGQVRNAVKGEPSVFYFVRMGNYDSLGHEYGPRGKQMGEALVRLDKTVEKMVRLFDDELKDPCFLILSAHGMSAVTHCLDLWSLLSAHDVRMPRDCIVFLDSTMARFWYSSEETANKLRKILQDLNGGHILTADEKRDAKIPTDDRSGQLVFALDEGTVIHPSYFHASQAPKGMHGYFSTSSPDGFAPLIARGADSCNIKDRMEYPNMFELLLTLMELRSDSTLRASTLGLAQ